MNDKLAQKIKGIRRSTGDKVPVLACSGSRKPNITTKDIAKIAYTEYVLQYGNIQTFDELHQRGGFGYDELVIYLRTTIARQADELTRLRSKKR